MAPEIEYVTRCSYCQRDNGIYISTKGERQCLACGRPWTPEMVKVTTKKVEFQK